MDDQRNRFGPNNEEQTNEGQEHQTQSSDSSSYYYSYGPFKSISDEDGQREGQDAYGQHGAQEVEITAPQPVKQIPAPSYASGASGQGNGNGGVKGESFSEKNSGGQWNFNNSKPKSSVKTVLLSFLAGMLVITGLMFAADRANLFTPDTVASQGADSGAGSSGGNNAATAVSAPSNPGDVTSVVDQASPAVTLIETFVKSDGSSQGNPYMNDPIYRFFFGDLPNGRSSNEGSSNDSPQLIQSGIGSGFIFDKSGYILTNEHVIHGADVIQVTLQDNKKPYEAKLLGSSYELDLAVLKIEGDKDFPYVELGNSEDLKVGEWLVAIGNPKGFEHTVTAGVLSSKERSIEIAGQNGEEDRNYEHLLQTDASINPGNSGGPLLNMNGEVIGMNVAVSAEAQGIGFAIPSETILEVLDYLKNGQEVPKEPVPFIGATLGTLTPQIAQQLGTDVKEGTYVDSVLYRSPAYEADLRQYDIITGVDGTKYATHNELVEFIKSKKVGDKITLNVVRNGKKLDLPLTIGDRNEYQASQKQQQ